MRVRAGDFIAEYYEIRRKSDNKRLHMLQIADDKNGYYERFKIDSDGNLVYNKELNLYEREYKKEPIRFVRNTYYFIILIGLFKRFFLDFIAFVKMEINVRKNKEE